jgi:hypothetical protein
LKYTAEEARQLQKKGELADNIKINDTDVRLPFFLFFVRSIRFLT